MTQVSVAPPPMPVVASPQATADPASAVDSASTAAPHADFAAVLRAQFGLPAKDASGTEIIAALLPSKMQEAAKEAPPADELPAAAELAALLAALQGLVPPPATQSPLTPEQQAAGPAGELPEFGAATDAPAMPAAPTALAAPPALAAPAVPGQAADETFAMEETAPATPQSARQVLVAGARPEQTEAIAAPPAANPPMPVEYASAQAAAAPARDAPVRDAPAVIRVDTPVGGRGWDAEVGQKIVLLANRQESRAELTLTPPQLGKVEITISVSGDQTSAVFVSASPAAREALEQALPRLREILAEAGITLGQASVNAESARQDNAGSAAPDLDSRRGTDAAESTAAPAQWVRRSNGLVDTFA